jgi:3-oxoacyl-[acyl-carrier protein] reductase
VTERTGRLAGRVVLVTGAGAGIGRALCAGCAAEGALVVATGRGGNVDETVEIASQRGGHCIGVRCDVTSRSDVGRAVATAVDRYGGLDAMIHNATSRRSSEVAELASLDPTLWDDHVAVSVRGAYLCAHAAFTHLRARRGCLLVMTSPAGIEGSATLPAYGAVKGALRGFAKSLAVEWGPSGVRVVAVSPLAATPALANAYRENPALEPRLRRLVPLGRVGDPDVDIAPVVAFLVGDDARYVTGQTVVVDGGRFTTM